jgi:tRNA-2-methylthio-N6-dimethylallyladenosine synthase
MKDIFQRSLLKAISNLDGDFQIYIRNLEPFWLLRYFDKFFEVVKMRKIRAITVPIQSGNDEVLRAMKRGHKIAPLREIFHRLTTETPYILILTHFMVGLPGEDAKAFKDSLKVIREVRFEGIAPDRFFAQPNTPAFTMDKQVPYLVKWWRYLVLFADIIWSVYFNRGNLKGLR